MRVTYRHSYRQTELLLEVLSDLKTFSLVLENKSVFFRQNHAIAISEAIKYDIKFILGKVLALTVTAGLLKCSNFVNTDSLNVFHLNSPI